MVTVLCVLKSGGIYGPDYVANLKRMVAINNSQFICLSDLAIPNGGKLVNGWPGWWSKIEVFQFGGKIIYLDLDTAIFGSLAPLVDALDEGSFYMLRPFKKIEDWASGIMAWNGDFTFLYRDFRVTDIQKHKWDQRYVSSKLETAGVKIRAIQSVLPGVYSYKWHCKNGPPPDARVVCFHGKPKPHEIGMPYWEMEKK